MVEHISREAAIELLSEPITMSMCLSVDECHHKIAQRRIDRYLIENIPAADVRPVKWKSVREYTPEPGRYLTCRKSMTTPPSYYYSILSYADNLESIDEYDFEGERIPGWFEYDSEYGHYSCDNVEWFMPLPPMPPNCGTDMKEES